MSWDIVIGAGLGLICSSIGALLTHRFHMKELKKNREWHIEDRDTTAKKDIAYQRLGDLENFARKIGISISKFKFKISMTGYPYSTQFDSDITNNLIQSASESYLFHLLDYFQDVQLAECFSKLIDLQNEMIDLDIALSEKINKAEAIDIDKIDLKLSDLKIESTFNSVIERIDYLKLKYSK